MTKLFVLGATGYIGGDALYVIANAHPEYEITCLARNSDKGASVAAQYAKVKLVYGDLDSSELIEEESKKADIVLNFAHADHAGAATAITTALATKATSSAPGFYIHTSGTGILLFTDIRNKSYGSASDKVYSDLKPEDLKELTSLPDDAPHRHVDKLILASGLKTAVVLPPAIYGPGRGPSNQRSVQVPDLARATLKLGYAPFVGEGHTRWGNVHVHDLSQLYLLLVEEAAAGGSKAEWQGKPEVWGQGGYYLGVAGEHGWKELGQRTAEMAKRMKLIESAEVRSVSAEKADELGTWGSGLWGANSRARGERAREVLGWKPEFLDVSDEEIERNLEFEAKGLGLKPGHAKVAAGDA